MGWVQGRPRGRFGLPAALIWLAFIVFPLIDAVTNEGPVVGHVLAIVGAALFVAGARPALSAAGSEAEVLRPAVGLDPDVEAVLAWAVREGATNVIRHSGAQTCLVRITAGLPKRRSRWSMTGVGRGQRTGRLTPGTSAWGPATAFPVWANGPRHCAGGWRPGLASTVVLGWRSACRSQAARA
jgi:hypothetical protein